MTTPRFQPRNGVLIGAAALLTACTPPGGLRNFDGDPWVKRNAEALDRMAARLNEYGTVGMSAPLIMTPDPNFEFSVKKGPEEYFNDAKTEIQARAAAVEQEVSLFGLNASASIDPTQMAKYGEALKTYQDERIDYLRQRTERDRALNAATAASNAATGPIDGEIAALNDEITRAYLAPADCGEAKSCIKPNVREQIRVRGNALAEELLGNFQQQYLPLCMVVPDLQACKDAARKEAEASRQQAAQPAAAQPLSAMPQPTQAGATRAANAKPTRTK